MRKSITPHTSSQVQNPHRRLKLTKKRRKAITDIRSALSLKPAQSHETVVDFYRRIAREALQLHNLADLARIAQVNIRTIRDCFKELGVRASDSPHFKVYDPNTPESTLEIRRKGIALIEADVSTSEIMRQLGVSSDTVSRWRKHATLPKRECPNCERVFRWRRNRRFCSEQCQLSYNKRLCQIRKKPSKLFTMRKVGSAITCPVCDRTFVKEERARKYCSDKCQRKNERRSA